MERPEIAALPADRGPAEPGRRHVGIVLPCYNEEGNVDELYERLATVFAGLPQYTCEMLFIDNASTDGTVDRIKPLIARDPRVKLIVNARNFGHIRSPFHAFLESGGDCVIGMCTDLQDPPELIPQFLEQWERGASMVLGKKKTSQESPAFFAVRGIYYKLARAMAEVPLLEHVTGFGLYDRRVIEIMRRLDDPYPYARGLIAEIGLPYVTIPYDQPLRKRGITKNNFYTLFDLALLGITSHSKVPLRVATLAGFLLSGLSLLVAVGFLILKLTAWYSLPAGYAPAVIGIFFLGSVQIFLIGLLGEYVGAVLTQVRKRPLVVERERVGEFVAPAEPSSRGSSCQASAFSVTNEDLLQEPGR
jgi:glycosyltransferase involved in cell wall biosynthesis